MPVLRDPRPRRATLRRLWPLRPAGRARWAVPPLRRAGRRRRPYRSPQEVSARIHGPRSAATGYRGWAIPDDRSGPYRIDKHTARIGGLCRLRCPARIVRSAAAAPGPVRRVALGSQTARCAAAATPRAFPRPGCGSRLWARTRAARPQGREDRGAERRPRHPMLAVRSGHRGSATGPTSAEPALREGLRGRHGVAALRPLRGSPHRVAGDDGLGGR